MPQINVLSQETIDKIAAGEVVERPSSVVKELVENAIDAKASAITVEIKEGGISLIRITDNGCGIERSQVPTAFLSHATSKIKNVEDLLDVHSLGFRGEALSSIAAVAQVELITKTYGELTGTRYVIEGSKEKETEEIGAPEGTTFLVRNLFFNTPVRRKFLKTPQTEGNYIGDLIERLALSHPDISFKFISNGQIKLHTSGNSKEKDMIYHIYGRDITASLLPLKHKNSLFRVNGFIGKPALFRGNRNYENYFINGRYIKSALISKAIEEAYKGFLMQHQYPFCVLYFSMDSELLDVNVHPNKMELRFSNNEEIYRALFQAVRDALTHKEFIPAVSVDAKKTDKKIPVSPKTPEPFERHVGNSQITEQALVETGNRKENVPIGAKEQKEPENQAVFERLLATSAKTQPGNSNHPVEREAVFKPAKEVTATPYKAQTPPLAPRVEEENGYRTREKTSVYEQQELSAVSKDFLTEDAKKKHKIIGQLFDTFWLIEYEDKLFIIDQHAAHEKVLYEKNMKRIENMDFSSQTLSPPIILTLSLEETEMLQKYQRQIAMFGYEIEPFGGKEYAITAIPADFSGIDMKSMFIEMLDDFANINGNDAPNIIMEKVASMSCKAAVKGNNHLSVTEMETLIDELLALDNPYNCPHGRPTIISMSKYEIEKKFKRIV